MISSELQQLSAAVGAITALNRMMPWVLPRRASAVTRRTTTGVDLAVKQAHKKGESCITRLINTPAEQTGERNYQARKM